MMERKQKSTSPGIYQKQNALITVLSYIVNDHFCDT